MSGTFDYIEWNALSQKNFDDIRDATEVLEELILHRLTSSREKSLAMTNLEQTFMWVGKAVRNDQLAKGMIK